MPPSDQLLISASWRFVAEFWRRYPSKFDLIETHPCSGMYDCLTLRTKDRQPQTALSLNRAGSLHVWPEALEQADKQSNAYQDWLPSMLGPEPSRFLDNVANDLRLSIPKKLPASTPETIVYRFIAEFLAHAIGRRETWDCRNGMHDTSGWCGGKQLEWFRKFAELDVGEKLKHAPALGSECAYSFWFLLKDGEPLICVDKTGLAHRQDGTRVDLMKAYKRHRRIWPIIHEAAGDLLP